MPRNYVKKGKYILPCTRVRFHLDDRKRSIPLSQGWWRRRKGKVRSQCPPSWLPSACPPWEHIGRQARGSSAWQIQSWRLSPHKNELPVDENQFSVYYIPDSSHCYQEDWYWGHSDINTFIGILVRISHIANHTIIDNVLLFRISLWCGLVENK